MLASLIPLALRVYVAPTAYKTKMTYKVIGPVSEAEMDDTAFISQLNNESLWMEGMRANAILSFIVSISPLRTLRAAMEAGVVEVVELDSYQQAKHNRKVLAYKAAERKARRQLARESGEITADRKSVHPWVTPLRGITSASLDTSKLPDAVVEELKLDRRTGQVTAIVTSKELQRAEIDNLRGIFTELRLDNSALAHQEIVERGRSHLRRLAQLLGTHEGTDSLKPLASPPNPE